MPKNSNEIQNNNKKQSNKKPVSVNNKKNSKTIKGSKKKYSKPSTNIKVLKKKTENADKTKVNKVKIKDKRQLNTNDKLFLNSYKSGNFKKKSLVLIIIVIIFLMIAIGFSFAYYLASVSITNKDNATSDMSSSGLVEASLDVKDKVSASNIYPGYQMAKKIILTGKGKKDYEPIDAGIVIKPNLGVFKNDVIWKLYKSEKEITCTSNIIYNSSGIYDDATCNIPSTAKLVLKGTYLENEYSVTVNYNTNDTYYLVVEYLNRDTDQSEQMNESFNIDIDLAAAGEQTVIKEIDHNVTLTNSVSSGGIKLSTLGDGVFELDGTSTASVNFRISDYYRASSPYNTYLYDATVPNNTIIMEKDKTYRISYEYISGSNNVDGFNNFRLCFAEPNSYRGLQTFAYDFYSGFIGSEKLVQNIGMYFFWINKGYTFDKFRFKIKIYEMTAAFDDTGDVVDVKTLDKDGTTMTAVWYDTGIIEVFGANDMALSDWYRTPTYINLTTHEVSTSPQKFYNSNYGDNPPYPKGSKVKIEYQLLKNFPDINKQDDYRGQIYLELIDTSSNANVVKPPSINSQVDDMNSTDIITYTDTLTTDINTAVLIVGKNVNFKNPWRFRFNIAIVDTETNGVDAEG